jgi:hypothetical protein
MPYQSTPADRTRAYIVGAIYVFLAFVLAVMLFKIWPPIPWPLPLPENATAKDKAKLAAQIKAYACPSTSPTPTATATPTPAANQNSNQAASSTGQGNTSQSGTPTPATIGTPSAAGAGRQTGTQPAGQTGTPPPTGTGGTQPGGQSQPQNSGTGQTTTPGAAATTPPVTTETNQQTKDTDEIVTVPMNLAFGYCPQTSFDERLLLLVIVAGMLGAFVHGATSLADYIGNNSFNKSWTWFYLLRPAIGMSLALVFYFAIRGGFLSTTGGAKDINPYGIAALAGMVGMFSKQATDKLSEIFGTLFRSAPGKGDAQRGDSLDGAAIGAALQLDPPSVTAGGEAFKLTVAGTGFVNGATIQLDDTPQTTTFESDTKLSAQIAKEGIATAGTRKVSVVNADQTKIGPVDFVVSPSGDDTATEKPVAGEGGDADLIDGCDVDMKADTPDEDLPITEGGVK